MGDPAPAVSEPFLPSLRTVLAAIFLFGAFGTGVELLLLDHHESVSQWIPLVLTGLSLAAMTASLINPTRTILRLVRALMIAYILSGLLGVWFHYRGSVDFQREVNPALAGFELFWKAVRSKAPPALAPGAMMQLGLVGLASTLRRPVCRRGPDHLTNKEKS